MVSNVTQVVGNVISFVMIRNFTENLSSSVLIKIFVFIFLFLIQCEKSSKEKISGVESFSSTPPTTFVEDNSNNKAEISCSLKIKKHLPGFIVPIFKQEYYSEIIVEGGIPPFKWEAWGLPKGLSMSNGKIVGIPQEYGGPFTVTIQVQDTAGCKDQFLSKMFVAYEVKERTYPDDPEKLIEEIAEELKKNEQERQREEELEYSKISTFTTLFWVDRFCEGVTIAYAEGNYKEICYYPKRFCYYYIDEELIYSDDEVSYYREPNFLKILWAKSEKKWEKTIYLSQRNADECYNYLYRSLLYEYYYMGSDIEFVIVTAVRHIDNEEILFLYTLSTIDGDIIDNLEVEVDYPNYNIPYFILNFGDLKILPVPDDDKGYLIALSSYGKIKWKKEIKSMCNDWDISDVFQYGDSIYFLYNWCGYGKTYSAYEIKLFKISPQSGETLIELTIPDNQYWKQFIKGNKIYLGSVEELVFDCFPQTLMINLDTMEIEKKSIGMLSYADFGPSGKNTHSLFGRGRLYSYAYFTSSGEGPSCWFDVGNKIVLFIYNENLEEEEVLQMKGDMVDLVWVDENGITYVSVFNGNTETTYIFK